MNQQRTAKEELEHSIEQVRINADTASLIADLLDQWGTKQFNKRFADALQAKLGGAYLVTYCKWYGDWRLGVSTKGQRHDDGITIYLGEQPTAARCRGTVEQYADGLNSDHISAAIFEVAHYDEIRAVAARSAHELKSMKARYGKYHGDLTYTMRAEVKRILEAA